MILAFDVKVERESQEMADSLGVRIFWAEIIYHLFDAFTKYREDYKKAKQEEFKYERPRVTSNIQFYTSHNYTQIMIPGFIYLDLKLKLKDFLSVCPIEECLSLIIICDIRV